ncbi:TPA: hypothetical protein N0F65_012549 [Lagenidium giganteum]|uniref:Uncharacterized protein n=1 Tax=Lagenidium giganteum TaxID=4803 RepID=A0AAV2YS35_9STRA|nr:TPA: hypothetical protein N0F65_012549 [Lagenidium giganteum]
MLKSWIHVTDDAAVVHRIAWYLGTSDVMLERAIRLQLQLPDSAMFLLRDGDGDLVPVAATLPSDAHFTLVLQEQIVAHQETSSNSGWTTSEEQRVTPKRRRRALDDVMERRQHKPSVASIVLHFIETFTKPIATDDDVTFIPNSGKYALYVVFCLLIPERRYHPKSQDAFYKMTSILGKVDRQRITRYYQDTLPDGTIEYVQLKPQGKGVFLRQYAPVSNDRELQVLIHNAEFVTEMDLDPQEVVAQYAKFIQSFAPIPRAEYCYQLNCDNTAAYNSEAAVVVTATVTELAPQAQAPVEDID